MLRGVQAGYELPETITEEQYQAIRANKDADPVLAGFVGFGCSFGGKWKQSTGLIQQSANAQAVFSAALAVTWKKSLTDFKGYKLRTPHFITTV